MAAPAKRSKFSCRENKEFVVEARENFIAYLSNRAQQEKVSGHKLS